MPTKTPTNRNTNYNHIEVKTDSIVSMLDQLSKLGVLKSKKKKARRVAPPDSIRQSSDLVGYTKTIPNILLAPQGASPSQIEDIQRRNDAVVAALRAEVQQQRLEDIQTSPQVFSAMGRFRGSPPQQSTGFQQSASVIELPDVKEESFKQSMSPDAPPHEEKRTTEVFATEEEESELPEGVAFAEIEDEPITVQQETPITGGGSFQPIEKIREEIPRSADLRNKRVIVAADFGLPAPPPERGTTRPQMEEYYRMLADRTQNPVNGAILGSKIKMFKAINTILDEYNLPQ